MSEIDDILKELQQKESELERKVAELKFAEADLKKVKDAIKALDPRGASKSAAAINRPVTFKVKLPDSWQGKILYALNELTEATAVDIIDFLLKKDKALDRDTVHSMVTTTASKLYREESIKAKQDGRRNIYYI